MTALEVARPRVMSVDDATALVGGTVPALEPNVTGAIVARDADTGAGVFAYLPVDGVAELRRSVLHLQWRETLRAGTGSRNKSRTFGYRPRKPFMPGGESCARAALAATDPPAHRTLEAWSRHLGQALREVLPDVAAADADTTASVLPDWRFGENEPWTSGVINRTSTLPYHRDRNNFPVWSAMPVVRRGVRGGHLAIPEYDAVIECRDGWALFFPGFDLVHGVTPMKSVVPDAYRISVVYYSLRGLKDCFTAARESAYGLERRTVRERDIAARLADGETGLPGSPPRPAAAKTEAELTSDLIRFARVELDAGDIEPWAAVLAELRRAGDLDDEQAAWAVKLYNASDDLGTAFRIYDLAGSPADWQAVSDADRATVAKLPLSQERRSLRGGRILRHLDDYAAALAGRPQLEWLAAGVPAGADPAAGFEALMEHMRSLWGVGRQTAFEWAEFAGKVSGLPVAAGDACLWESSGPRQALEKLFGRNDPTPAELDSWALELKGSVALAGVELEWWDFETVICDFNVMRKGRYYPGQHLAMIREEVESLPDPYRALLSGALLRIVPDPWREIPAGVDRRLRPLYRDTGQIPNPFVVELEAPA